MIADRLAVLGKLKDRARAAEEKGGDAMLDTREIADRLGWKIARARRHLWALEAEGRVAAIDGAGTGYGGAIFWELTYADPVGEGFDHQRPIEGPPPPPCLACQRPYDDPCDGCFSATTAGRAALERGS